MLVQNKSSVMSPWLFNLYTQVDGVMKEMSAKVMRRGNEIEAEVMNER